MDYFPVPIAPHPRIPLLILPARDVLIFALPFSCSLYCPGTTTRIGIDLCAVLQLVADVYSSLGFSGSTDGCQSVTFGGISGC
jgi:hypothetical protein